MWSLIHLTAGPEKASCRHCTIYIYIRSVSLSCHFQSVHREANNPVHLICKAARRPKGQGPSTSLSNSKALLSKSSASGHEIWTWSAHFDLQGLIQTPDNPPWRSEKLGCGSVIGLWEASVSFVNFSSHLCTLFTGHRTFIKPGKFRKPQLSSQGITWIQQKDFNWCQEGVSELQQGHPIWSSFHVWHHLTNHLKAPISLHRNGCQASRCGRPDPWPPNDKEWFKPANPLAALVYTQSSCSRSLRMSTSSISVKRKNMFHMVSCFTLPKSNVTP